MDKMVTNSLVVLPYLCMVRGTIVVMEECCHSSTIQTFRRNENESEGIIGSISDDYSVLGWV